jgi:thioredoxin:protein disulfide reductase
MLYSRTLLTTLTLLFTLLAPAEAQVSPVDDLFNSALGPKTLTADQALAVRGEQKDSVFFVYITVAPKHKLYRDKIQLIGSNATLGEWHLPKGTLYDDPQFGQTRVLDGDVQIRIPLTSVADGGTLTVHYQGCSPAICYPLRLHSHTSYPFRRCPLIRKKLTPTTPHHPPFQTHRQTGPIPLMCSI